MSGLHRLAAAALAVGLLLVAGSAAPQGGRTPPIAPHRPWAQDKSDLKPDPIVVFGVMPNGLKYAVRRNTIPAGQVAIRLVIDGGAMHERNDQAGIAHFIEHMAFRGSNRIPDGDVRSTLERLGLRYGRDINAATEGAQTFYKFNLAKNDEATLDTGLSMLREIASELTLDPATLDAERDVVLAELRAKRTPQLDLLEALARWQLGDHPFARGPGGSPAVVQAATAAKVREFYDAYYRPERATVVIVGDINVDQAEQKLRRAFMSWRGRGAPGADPAPLARPPTNPSVTVVTLPGVENDGLEELWFHPYAAPDVSAAGERQRWVQRVGQLAMRLRLRRMLEPDVQPFEIVDGLGTADIGQVASGDLVSLSHIRNLPEALDFQVRTRRQISDQGITREEMEDAIGFLRASLDTEIGQVTLRTSQIADALTDGADQVYLAGPDRRAVFERAASSMTLSEVNATLRARMSGPSAMLYYGPAEPPGGQAGLAARLAAAQGAPAVAYVPPPVKPWTYTSFGPAGRVAERRTDNALGATLIRFENNVRLTIKPTGYTRNEVQVKVRFGRGRLAMPTDALGPSDFGFLMFYDGGLKGYSETELARTLSGKRVAAMPGQADDAFELTNSATLATPPDQLELQLQRMAAPFVADAWRPDHWAGQLKENVEQERSDPFTPEGIYARYVPALLHSGDLRWVYSSAALQATWKPEEAADWMRPIAETSPIEVIIVGEVNVARAIEMVSRTFGALPARPDAPEPPGLRAVRFPAPTPTPVQLFHKGPADQAMVVIAWPGTDALANTRQTQAANLLSLILGNRLLDELRTRQARTYSPAVAEQFSRTFPGYGLISVRITVRPEDAASVMAAIEQVAADLAARDISADEFNRARNPRLEFLTRAQYSDSTWMAHLSNLQTDPRLAGLMARALPETANLTRADIRSAAQAWLVKDRAWRAVILPEAATSSP